MRQRITIMLDEDISKKIRLLQAKSIKKTTRSVSFSDTIEEVLKAGLKNGIS